MSHVQVSNGTIALTAYPKGPDDREPPLLREFTPRNAEIYPYTTQELLGDRSITQEFATVCLENSCLKLTFLPQLNGRLYSAFDKINNKEVFYANPAIKLGLFAVRGAWAAVGVEFNFPNSHTSTTLDPAQCITRTHDDGSASVIVGNVDKTSRMAWSVETRLRPDSSAIEMESRLYNPTDLPQRFYYWVNAACPVYPDSEFIYPPSTRRLLTHPPMDSSRLACVNYPVHKGVDIRFFRNIKQHFPIFAEDMHEDFFGLYHHKQDFGVAHVADRSLVRGRKIWTFGTARDGRIFIDQLCDTGQDYCELQTGPFSLQSDYRLLQPGRMHVQREYWLPVSNTGGFNLACTSFAAKVERNDSRITIRLCAAQPLANAAVSLRRNGNKVDSLTFNAQTCEAITLEIDAPKATCDSITFEDADGVYLCEYALNPPAIIETHSDVSGTEGFIYLRGKYLEEQGAADRAAWLYEANADTDGSCSLSAARLAYDRGDWTVAKSRLEALLAIDRDNPDALILNGLLQFREGNDELATRCFSRAADSNRHRDRAVLHLARVATARRDYRRAMSLIDELEQFGTPEERVLRLKTLCLEKLGGDAADARRRAGELLPICDPMEQICELIALRHYMDAYETLCEHAHDDSARDHYYLAWLQHMIGNESQVGEHLTQAFKHQWNCCFAYRIEDEPVLRFALDVCPTDSTTNYQLGCLLAFKNRWDEAEQLWKAITAGVARCDTQRNLALYYWKIKKDYAAAADCFKAVTFSPDAGVRSLIEAEMFFEETGDDKARLAMFEKRDDLLEQDSRLRLAQVKALLANDRPAEALDLLLENNFRLCEGKSLSRRLYETACEALARKAAERNDHAAAGRFYTIASQYPESIGIGKPSGNKEAQWHYKAGMEYRRLDQQDKALECFTEGAATGDWLDIDFFPLKTVIWESPWENIDVPYWSNVYFRARCLEKIDNADQATIVQQRFDNYLKSLEDRNRTDEDGYRKLKLLEGN